jgi:methionine synthase II (cobalamin-independent)
MKLQELAVANPKQQAAKVFESYFGDRVNFNTVSKSQAHNMLKSVRKLIAEHRRTTAFHSSERNPTYLKLVMMEQALAAAATAPGTTPTANPANVAMDMAARKKQAQDQAAAITKQIQELTQQKNQILQQANNPMAEGRRGRRLREASEIQQAQVVLAAQDMVDQVQKMSEQVSAMQFKDLPALIDQIKNEVGVDQATQFNGDASAALSGLLQNLSVAKQQLEAALGVVTGQAPQVPGDDMGVAPGQEEINIDAELPTPDGEEDIDAEMDANIEPTGLGRERR